jgi:hypothetical protein
MESFNEYKKTLDIALMNIDYLYSGDINSTLSLNSYSEIKTNQLTSPSFIQNCIKKIYKESFNIVKNKCKEVIIPNIGSPPKIKNIFSKIDSVLVNPNRYIFASKSSYNYIGFDSFKIDNSRGLPGYLYHLTKIVEAKSTIYYSPEVEEEDDAFILYATDQPFQSIVYSLQNMEYKISQIDDNTWDHKIFYTLYDCKFSSVKIIIKNIIQIRDEKIKEILS